ncbi:gfo/Idh/MocA family oxidoreductase [Oxalobacteraceae bacterium CAVE-383]|nr:gfo/Idh/MocA family oxidoreductase [Oxalobacteraceae bacterium CAVE-383]
MITASAERYLIVSLGSIGRRHLRNLRRLRPHAQIGVLRLHSGIVEGELPEGVDIQFHSLEDALSFCPAAAIIAGPASTHLALSNGLVAAQIPVLIEKPIADRSEGIADLADAAEWGGIPVIVGYNLRFLPSLQASRKLLDDGLIGEILLVRAEVGQYLPDWRPDQPYRESVSAQKALGGGALLELSHEIDYIYWILGMPASVSARGGSSGSLDIDVEDAVELILEYENPAMLVNIHLDFLQRAPARSCKFIGKLGTLIWNGITDSVDVFLSETGQWCQIDTEIQSDRNQMYIDELAHFLDGAQATNPIASDMAQGRDVLTIIEAAKMSMASNTTVKITPNAQY